MKCMCVEGGRVGDDWAMRDELMKKKKNKTGRLSEAKQTSLGTKGRSDDWY